MFGREDELQSRIAELEQQLAEEKHEHKNTYADVLQGDDDVDELKRQLADAKAGLERIEGVTQDTIDYTHVQTMTTIRKIANETLAKIEGKR